jgi:DNA polymerase-3 subunit epsilon
MASLAMARILLVAATAEPCPERTLERYWLMFAEKPWACTVNEIEWRKHGFEGSRLEYLAAGIGMFHEAHWAADDCRVIGDYDRNTLRLRLGLHELAHRRSDET